MFEKGDYQNNQTDSKNEKLLLSSIFTEKFELVFVLAQKNAFSHRFHFKDNRKSRGFSNFIYLPQTTKCNFFILTFVVIVNILVLSDLFFKFVRKK